METLSPQIISSRVDVDTDAMHFSGKLGNKGNLLQFEIQMLESLLAATQHEKPKRVLYKKYAMIWVLKGEGKIAIDMRQMTIEDTTVYYIKPGQSVELNLEKKSKGFVISFVQEFVDLYERNASELKSSPLFNQLVDTPAIKIATNMIEFMRSIATKMLQEFENYHALRSEVLRGFFKIFIVYLSRQCEESNSDSILSRKVELVNIFYSLVEKYFVAKKMVREYAEMLSVTPSYLNDIIKQKSGFTASHHIRQRIVLEAKRRAIYEGASMKEIAYQLGFYDPAHFSKYFKNSSGINFTDFKKRLICPNLNNTLSSTVGS